MPGDLPPEEFRKIGYQTVDWIANYLANIRQHRVLPNVEPGVLTDALPQSAPDLGEPMERIFEDFRKLIIPGITHWNHPRFFAYFAISASGAGILGEMLTAALNVNGMLWKTSPAVTELEQVTLRWLRQWLGLPEAFFGIIYDTASVSSLHAIAAAREMADPDARVRGATPNLTLYVSEHAHSSVEKAAILLGIGQQNVRKISADAKFSMDVDALSFAIERDRLAGLRPFCVVATVGTTSTASVDPVPEIADLAQKHGLWLHVDAAYAGPAAIVPELQHIFRGVERADSLVVNPHKWLLTPIDLSVLYTRRPEILRRAFLLVPEFLKTEADPRALNYMEYGIQLGRRFRALKFWFVLRYFGREGVVAIIREHIRLAQQLSARIAAEPDFELAADTLFSLVCFRYKGSNDQNRRLLEAINSSGQAFLSQTVLNGQFVLRLAIGNIGTNQGDMDEVWKTIKAAAREIGK